MIILLGTASTPGMATGAGSVEREFYRLYGEVQTDDGQRVRGQASSVILKGAYAPFLRRTLTDLAGRYHFDKVPKGVYVVRAVSPGKGVGGLTVDVSESLADPRGRIELNIIVAPLSDIHEVSVSQLSIPEKALKAFQKALESEQEGDIEKSVRLLEKAISIAPEFSVALNQRGIIAYLNKDYEVARGYFERAREADPEAYPPLVNLGGTLVSLGLYQRALPINRQAVDLRPDDPLALAQLGMAYMGLGRDQEAADYLTRAKEIEPGHFSYPQLNLATVLWRNGLQEAAIAELEEFLLLHPDVPQAEFVRDRLREVGRLP